MKSISIPHIQFAPSAADFPMCLDLLMAHNIALHGEDWRRAFSLCCRAKIIKNAMNPMDALVFPHFEFAKYRTVGIDILKKQADSQEILTAIEHSLAHSEPLIIHFDAFFCPWDSACFQKRHNDHMIFITGISRNKKYLSIADVYFGKYHKIVHTNTILQASRFYLQITFPAKIRFIEPTNFTKELTRFSNTLKEFTHMCEKPGFLKRTEGIPFAEGSYKILQRGRISQYFFRMYLLYLAEQGDSKASLLSERLEEADYLWVNCLTYIIRGAWNFYYTEQGLLKHIYRLCDFYSNILFGGRRLESTPCIINRTAVINIRSYFNGKMFLPDDACELSDFIEGEKLCIVPLQDVSEITSGARRFRLYPHGDKDNIRADGQKINCGNILCKGISLLCVAECGDAAFSLSFIFNHGDCAQKHLLAEDFPKKSENAIDVGDAYTVTRWRAYDRVYARVLDVFFDNQEYLKTIILPKNPHLHILALAVIL